jgi:hypothetical protein
MHLNILLDVGIYLPVILQIILLLSLLYIPLPIALWIYRRRKEKLGAEKTTTDPKFDAEGTFQGFKISAGGSVALYFILFVACLSASVPIMTSIGRTRPPMCNSNAQQYR